MPKKWEQVKNLESGGHCCVFGVHSHYHTRHLEESEKRWYLDRGYWISRHCLAPERSAIHGNPDQAPVYIDG